MVPGFLLQQLIVTGLIVSAGQPAGNRRSNVTGPPKITLGILSKSPGIGGQNREMAVHYIGAY